MLSCCSKALSNAAVVIADRGYDAADAAFSALSPIARAEGHGSDDAVPVIAARYFKLGANFFAFVKFSGVRTWLRSIELTA
jgi:hypothetical protein